MPLVANTLTIATFQSFIFFAAYPKPVYGGIRLSNETQILSSPAMLTSSPWGVLRHSQARIYNLNIVSLFFWSSKYSHPILTRCQNHLSGFLSMLRNSGFIANLSRMYELLSLSLRVSSDALLSVTTQSL